MNEEEFLIEMKNFFENIDKLSIDLEEQITDLNNKIVELEHNSIPVSLVEEKIEELKSNPLKIKQNDKYYYETHAYNKIIISVLQELIEGRK